MQKEKRLRVFDANLLYFIGAIIFLTAGAYFQQKNVLSGLVITQIFIVLFPPIIYLLIKKINIKRTMRFNKISLKHGFLVALITLFMYPVAVVANAVMMFLLSLLGNLEVPQIPMPETGREYIIMILIASLLAGFCEEVFFRGFILSGYEPLGKKKAVIISGILFGFFHFNIYNLAGPIVLGLVFGYLVILTDSLWAGVIGHMVNNGFAVSMGFLVNHLTGSLNTNEVPAEAPEISTTLALLISIFIIATFAIVTGFIAYLLIQVIKKDQAMVIEEEKEKDITNNCYDDMLEKENAKTRHIEFFPLYLTVPLYIFVASWQIMRIVELG